MPTLAVKAYEDLRLMIVVGKLPPGARLVNRKIADEIGVSMTPVREAVNRLASEGLVELTPGVGAFVRSVTITELANLYEIREAIEPLAARHSARSATPAEIDRLRAINNKSFAVVRAIAATGNGHANGPLLRRWLQNEQAFHEQIFAAAHNIWLTKYVSDLSLIARGFAPHRSLPEYHTAERCLSTWRDHRRLTRAIATRRPDQAAEILHNHIVSGKHRIMCLVDSRGLTE